MTNQEIVTIHGYVRALPKQGNREDIARVVVVTEDGTEYHILHKGVGVDLLEHVSTDVEVKGIVSEKEETLFLLVRSYQLVDDFGDTWYDDASDEKR